MNLETDRSIDDLSQEAIVATKQLINNSEKCAVYLDIIETGFSYNTKSAGYSFGTDKSIEKSKNQNNSGRRICAFL